MKQIKYLFTILALSFCFQTTVALATPKKAEPKPTAKSTKPATATTPKAETAPPKANSGGTGMFQQSMGKLPTFIKSDSVSLKSETRTFTYSGNVEIAQGDMILTAQSMDGNYDENNKIKQLIAKGNVLITKGPLIHATGERAIYEADTETVVLTENPELQQDGSILSADKIRVYLNENRSVAEGTVRVKLIQKEQAAVDSSSVLKSQR